MTELNYNALQSEELIDAMIQSELTIYDAMLFADPETVQTETVDDFMNICGFSEEQAMQANAELINW